MKKCIGKDVLPQKKTLNYQKCTLFYVVYTVMVLLVRLFGQLSSFHGICLILVQYLAAKLAEVIHCTQNMTLSILITDKRKVKFRIGGGVSYLIFKLVPFDDILI